MGRPFAVACVALGLALRSAAAQEAPRPAPASIDIAEDGRPIAALADEPGTATLVLLRALEARHAEARTVYGEFEQLKVSEIFLEETRSRARFWFEKPDRFRVEYTPPDALTNLIVEEAIYVYVPAIEQVEVYRFASRQERDQQLHSLVLGFGFKADDLVRDYIIRSSLEVGDLAAQTGVAGPTGEPIALLDLSPRPAVMETSPFVELKLWVDTAGLLPQRVWFEDYNGETTMIRIEKIDLNLPPPEGIFRPVWPRGTEIIDKTPPGAPPLP